MAKIVKSTTTGIVRDLFGKVYNLEKLTVPEAEFLISIGQKGIEVIDEETTIVPPSVPIIEKEPVSAKVINPVVK